MLKIALIAPFEEPVPPRTYGGTERVVWNLARELVKLEHDVTLFASKDSRTTAKLVPCVDKAIRVLPEARIPSIRQGLHLKGLGKALAKINKSDFDIVHNHFGWPMLMFAELVKSPLITTLHGSLDEPTENFMHNLCKNTPFVSISNAQRRHAKKLNYVATVYNGIDVSRFEFNDKPEDYLVFLGRIHPQKGPQYAIEIAKKTNHRLIIAAKIDPLEQAFFDHKIKPLIDGKQIKFIGEVDHRAKVKLLKNAKAMISPIQWDEPFGITNIEALACGTPVISINRGSIPEILVDGKTGYLCNNIRQMIKRVSDIDKIDRAACRRHVEQNFTARHMAEGYLKAYEKVIQRSKRLR